jgi:subtilisin family serine protease
MPSQAGQTGSDGTRRLLSKLDTTSIAASKNTAITTQIASLRRLASSNGSIKVIVGLRVPFAPEGLLSEPDKTAQRSEITASAEKLFRTLQTQKLTNPESVRSYERLPFMAMEVTAAELERLARDSNVISIIEDRQNRSNLLESVPLVGAPAAWSSGYSGKGQVVAVIDTGVDGAHPFLRGKVVAEACYSGAGNPKNSLCPGSALQSTSVGSGRPCPRKFRGCDHGTHVAGIVAGSNSSFSGVAKDANLIAIQVFSKSGRAIGAWDSDIISALERVSALRNDFAIAAVNMSLGRDQYSFTCDYFANSAMTAAIETLKSQGIATVVSSGNDKYTSAIEFPACISSAISVGATWDMAGDSYCGRRNKSAVDQVACFSNSADFLTLLAPGARINSSVPGTRYNKWIGTSMAAPHVAAAWAILKQKNPSASVDEIRNFLISTGKGVVDSRNAITKSRIDIAAALNPSIGGFTSSSYSVNENQGRIEISVIRSNAVNAASINFYTYSGVLDYASDFSASDYKSAWGTLTFPPGTATRTIVVQITDDAVHESSEAFRVKLLSPSGMTLSPVAETVVNIVDDDVKPSLRFAEPAYSVVEGQASVTIRVEGVGQYGYLSGYVFSADETAKQGRDYSRIYSHVSLYGSSEERTRNIVVPIVEDTEREGDETFLVKLDESWGSVSAPAIAKVTIIDNDGPAAASSAALMKSGKPESGN